MDLLTPLKKYFGFTSFRPLQEEIIQDSLAGRDVFALLPTGGGKSLCYQLPALVKPGLTLVVSPLIALMKDQVQALERCGVAATFLNSSLDGEESRARLRDLHQGKYSLLYAAPERLMLSGFLEDLKKWKVSLIAIDESHCISEWGHDFRPEYRKLSELRGHFPGVPVMALTATATPRVQTDIVRQLRLKDPAVYTASFNRPNLTYRMQAKSGPDEQVLNFLETCKGESGIIYCHSRKTAESTAEWLVEQKIKAAPYHAGLTAAERSRCQDAFLKDDVQVICATIAFGMGINKPNVRFVIHYDLPKNIEGYYQETGRAGRDGLPSECLLLFSAGDAVKQFRFIDEKPDAEREIARKQLEQMVHYAESSECRRKTLLNYFGEVYDPAGKQFFQHPAGADALTSTKENCGACDNCISPRVSYDGTQNAQKFLSCVYRIRQRNGFGVGMKHIIEVLTGAETEKIKRWHHEELSTYGIGKDCSRKDWAVIGRELIRLGLLAVDTGKFSTAELTQAGKKALKERQTILLTPQKEELKKVKSSDSLECDETLFERLRGLRKHMADERGIPAYMIFSDVSLRQMARNYPSDEREFSRISGVGQKKLEEFGQAFLAEIGTFLRENQRRTFTSEAQSPAVSARLNQTGRETLRRFREGESIEEISRARALMPGTIYTHLAEACAAGEEIDISRILTPDDQKKIEEVFSRIGHSNLTGVYELLDRKFDYGLLRLCRSAAQRPKTPAKK